MREVLTRLWHDEAGCLLAVQWVYVASILVLGIGVGVAVQRGVFERSWDDFRTAVREARR